MKAKSSSKDIDYTRWSYIAETIKRLRSHRAESNDWFTALPTASLVRIAKDLGIREPLKITTNSLRYAAVAAFQLGLFHGDLSEEEWNNLAAHSRFTLSGLSPQEFDNVIAAFWR